MEVSRVTDRTNEDCSETLEGGQVRMRKHWWDGGAKRFPMEDHTPEVRGAGWDPRWASCLEWLPRFGGGMEHVAGVGRALWRAWVSTCTPWVPLHIPQMPQQAYKIDSILLLIPKAAPRQSPWQQSWAYPTMLALHQGWLRCTWFSWLAAFRVSTHAIWQTVFFTPRGGIWGLGENIGPGINQLHQLLGLWPGQLLWASDTL